MALTLKKEQALKDNGLDKLFDQHKKVWLEKAKKARAYFDDSKPKGEVTREDDVAGVLLPMLDVDETLRDYLQDNRLTQKYWVSYFCDYVIDKTWNDLSAKGGGK